jgi:hypothetical protein
MKPAIKPLGIGDLKVVKQKLARYEAGEIAHIENMMAQEHRKRTHRRLQQSEEIMVREQERLEESLRDLQSTERFEMQNESQHTIRSETSSQAGLNLSAQYGPAVSLSAFANFSTNSSQEESERNSIKYAKEITDKTLSKLVEKVREERRSRTFEETEETNEHGFDPGNQNNSGIYRWVDKYYRAKVVNYGKRLMYEFIVPEPAAFYTFASLYKLNRRVLPKKPEQPTINGQPLTPSKIDSYNYLSLASLYSPSDIQPPPVQIIMISKALHREFKGATSWSFKDEDLKIPKGYIAVQGWVSGYEIPSVANGFVGFTFGADVVPAVPWTLTCHNESGSFPISGIGYESGYAVNVMIQCNVIPEYYEKWRLETYKAIMTAYYKALLDYEEHLAAAQIGEGVAIGGQNPEINRQIEKQELRRACIELWAMIQIGLPSAVSSGNAESQPTSYPQINPFTAAQNAEIIQVFEHAFEWKYMTYEFLPYFWGNKPRWIDLLSLESTDPIFEQFLKAGAVRVMVPVDPAYMEVVLFYQLTGMLWTGGPIPSLSGIVGPDAQLYNSYIEEMADVEELPDIEQDVRIDPDDETTWLIKVPTTLVWLQNDTDLPDLES